MKERPDLWPIRHTDTWVYVDNTLPFPTLPPNIPEKDNVTVYAAYRYKGGDPGAWGTTELMFVREGVWWIDDSLKGGEAEQPLGDNFEVIAWFPLPLFPCDNGEDEEVALMKDGTVIDRATGQVVNRLPGAPGGLLK